MKAKEKHGVQKKFTTFAYIVIILSVFVLPGIDYRYKWSRIPDWIPIIFLGIIAIAFIYEYVVVKENDYIFRTIEFSKEQRIVDNGLYFIIRHPMYLFGMIIVTSMPLVLGSIYGFFVSFTLLIPLFVMRILYEEDVLSIELNGYKEYMGKVKYRLIPFIWKQNCF